MVIQELIEQRPQTVEVVDLGWGNEPYKWRWTDDSVRLNHIRIQSGIAATMLRGAGRVSNKLRSLIRR